MLIGELLIQLGYATTQDIERALERQRKFGGLLGENLLALGVMSSDQLAKVLNMAPLAPRKIEDIGLSVPFLINLILKFMYVKSLETPSQIAADIKLPVNIVETLLEMTKEAELAVVLGASGLSLLAELRYELTGRGRERAADAMARSQYLGAAPIPLATYIARITRQRVANERVTRDGLQAKLGHLVLPPGLLEELGPAANSARAILLYGPPGSGKTSIAEAVGSCFKNLVYVPYAVELDGQIITIYDPTMHLPVESEAPAAPDKEADSEAVANKKRPPGEASLFIETTDTRWVACKRPVVMAGGELRLDMLDLRYSEESGIYEAPLQVKAMNGIFVMDDFGRQMVDPRDLLNRWIVPLERRFDFLHLHSGKKFLIPFDVLIVFSTNLAPEDLMDEAFLRRIPYKIHIGAPTIEDFAEIFRAVCDRNKVQIPSGLIDELLRDFYRRYDESVASYHPKFLIERVVDRARYAGGNVSLNRQELDAAWRNLFVEKGKYKRAS